MYRYECQACHKDQFSASESKANEPCIHCGHESTKLTGVAGSKETEGEEENHKYYFTFGSSGQIYEGGWVEIHADSLLDAQRKFIDRFGNDAWAAPGVLNYAFHYSEEEFRETIMGRWNNYGKNCHEVIK